jgi:hypothetical protein
MERILIAGRYDGRMPNYEAGGTAIARCFVLSRNTQKTALMHGGAFRLVVGPLLAAIACCGLT